MNLSVTYKEYIQYPVDIPTIICDIFIVNFFTTHRLLQKIILHLMHKIVFNQEFDEFRLRLSIFNGIFPFILVSKFAIAFMLQMWKLSRTSSMSILLSVIVG